MKRSDLARIREAEPLFFDVTRLELWHVFDMARAGLTPFARALACWTRLGRYFSEPDPARPGWEQFVARLREIYDQSIESDIDQAVDQAMAYAFGVIVAARAARRGADGGKAPSRSFGCFRYDVSEPTLAQLHFGNAVRPKSPFADMRALCVSLRDLIADIRRTAPGVRTICCGSWVNNLRAFRKLFPPGYLASLTPTSPENKTHGGWWGQFVTREGKLNERRAGILKRDRRFEFAELEGRCPLDDLARHVEAMLADGPMDEGR